MKQGLLISAALGVILISSPAQARGHRHWHHHHSGRIYDAGTVIGNPAGCPRTDFCGCGAALHVFGRNVRELWLAANWFRFPRAAPAPGMAAVRRHHVMIIEQVMGNGRAITYDANSGGHRTRVHEVSLVGYSIVNPHG